MAYAAERPPAIAWNGVRGEPTMPPEATVSTRRLALYLSRPSLVGEFRPAPPWEHAVAPPARSYARRPGVTREVLASMFRESLDRCVADSKHVAVLFSGGIDSAAVLWNAARGSAAHDRLVTPIVVQVSADDGSSSLAYARETLAALGVDRDPIVIEGERSSSESPIDGARWDARGPSLAPMPAVLDTAIERAAAAGASVLLTGDGADELLGVPRFALRLLARERRGAGRYVRDAYGSAGPAALVYEAVAAIGDRLSPSRRSRLYLAASSPELCDVDPSPALSTTWWHYVREWTMSWVGALLLEHIDRRHTWCEADAHDAFFPWYGFAEQSAKGSIPVRAPFLDDQLVDAALSLPLADRFDRRLPTPYLRRKAVVSHLLPPTSHPLLPREKQIFSGTQTRYARDRLPDLGRCRAIGLVDETSRDELTTPDWQRLSAIEHWLRGAEERGARLLPAHPSCTE